MSTRIIKKSTLFLTSSASDVQCVGGEIVIPGLNGPIRKKDLKSITQTKYRPEVAQVVTIGNTAYTPYGGVNYSIALYDPLRTPNGYNESIRLYSIRTPDDINQAGSTPALQREWIHAALVAKVNLFSANNFATAATLGSGNGFTVTDRGGYYPVFSQGSAQAVGANTVFPVTNTDGTGFADTNFTVTTAAVYSSGIGAKLLLEKPVVDYVFGNVVSGIIEDAVLTPTGATAVAGQNYDMFFIESYQIVDGLTLGGQYVYQLKHNRIFVDNGTGTSTTNLAGFNSFEFEMRKLMVEPFKLDSQSVIQFFDQNFVEQGALGGAPSGTASAINKFLTPYGMLNHIPIGTQTILTAAQGAAGLLLEQDATATEGAAYTPELATLNSQSFVVGKATATVFAKASFTTPANIVFMVGFRTKEAHQAAFASYQGLATVGTGAAGTVLSTYGNLAAGTPVVTSSGTNALTTVVNDFRVQVDGLGFVTAYINGVKYPIYSVGTTQLRFTAGTTLIPFMQYTNLNSAAAVPTVTQFVGVPTDQLIA